jgi:hypothetical protein
MYFEWLNLNCFINGKRTGAPNVTHENFQGTGKWEE